jgi:cytochrome P450
MQHEAAAVGQAWQHAAHTDQSVHVSAWMARLSFRIIGRAVLGMAPAALDDVAPQLQALAVPLRPALTTGSRRLRNVLQALQLPSQRRMRQAVATYQSLAQGLIMARRRRLQQEPGPPPDVLGQLLAAHATGTYARLTEQQLRDEVITLIGAGTETSALALGWTWYLLALHPHVEQQLHAELDTVLAGRFPTVTDLPHLPYSRAVLDEALRLYPPAAVLPRQANAEDVVQGYAVPKNALLLLSPYITHRHPDFWPAPEHFCPERFLTPGCAVTHRFAYFPFGAGPRLCLGQAFALQEMHLALATLAQHFTLRLLPDRPVLPVLAPTLQVRGGLWMRVQRRGGSGL